MTGNKMNTDTHSTFFTSKVLFKQNGHHLSNTTESKCNFTRFTPIVLITTCKSTQTSIFYMTFLATSQMYAAWDI